MSALIAVRIEIVRPDPAEPLIIKNDRTTPLTLISLQEPARQSRVGYAPSPAWRDSETPLSTTWQQALLGFSAAARDSASETVAQGLFDELADAVHPLVVPVTVFYEGGFSRTWACHGGSVVPDERDYVNLRDHDPACAVSIPCHPIPVTP